MFDQAAELRKLVLRALREDSQTSGPPPRLVVLAGGKGGVGVTTLAVNLSIALAEQGARVVVVDADLSRSDAATLCGLSEQQSVADVVIARRDIHEILQRGPAGIQIVPGLWAPGSDLDYSEMAQERLLRQFQRLGRHADVVMLDVGSGSNEFIRRFCGSADDVLLVTTPDVVSVMDSYARIKTTLSGNDSAHLWLVANFTDESRLAADVHRRIDQSCRRFLGLSIGLLGHVPRDEQVVKAASSAVPVIIGVPSCPASKAVQRLAAALATRKGDYQDSLPAAA